MCEEAGQFLAATPETVEDAIVILLLAVAEINEGNAYEEGHDIIERG